MTYFLPQTIDFEKGNLFESTATTRESFSHLIDCFFYSINDLSTLKYYYHS